MKKILFIHHGAHNGGAPLSMLYTMLGLREAGYNPVAGLRNNENKKLHELYNSHGFETINTSWIPIFLTYSASEGKRYNPIMWRGVYNAWAMWRNAKVKLKELIKKENIDIVHLNSASLSNPASALMEIDFPFVWHVREHGPKHKGRRYRFISDRLKKAKHVIFLSKAEQKSWVGDSEHGTIVHNFVDFAKFSNSNHVHDMKKSLGISNEKRIILYVGGIQKHKGILTLLKTLAILKTSSTEPILCLMPHAEFDINNPVSRLERRASEIIKKEELEEMILLLPFNPNIVPLFAVCDLLVFPATVPHFARPVVEASAMKKPVVVSDISPMEEQVKDGVTGLFAKCNDENDFAAKIMKILSNKDLAQNMGIAGHKYVYQEFEQHQQIKKILKVYSKVQYISPMANPNLFG